MKPCLHISSVALLISWPSSSEQCSTCPRWVTNSSRWPEKKNLPVNFTLGDERKHINCVFAALNWRLCSIAKSSHSLGILSLRGQRGREQGEQCHQHSTATQHSGAQHGREGSRWSSSSTYTVKSIGNKTPPCLTSSATSKDSDTHCQAFHFTAQDWLLYHDQRKRNKRCGTPLFSRILNRVLWLTRSKAIYSYWHQ